MFVVGVDPGLTRCGFAVLDFESRDRIISAGVLESARDLAIQDRLASLHADLLGLFSEFPPSVVVVERVLFQTNVKTAMSVGQAAGVALCVAAMSGAEVVSYSSNEVKLTLCGSGSATKSEVQMMVQREFGLIKPPSPPDVADAIGLALHHWLLLSRGLSTPGQLR